MSTQHTSSRDCTCRTCHGVATAEPWPRRAALALAVGALLGGGPVWANCTAVPSGNTPDATTGILQPNNFDTVTCSGTSAVSVSKAASTAVYPSSVTVNISGSLTPPTFTNTTVFSRPAVSLGERANVTNDGAITIGNAIADNEGAITIRGAGARVENNGTISVKDGWGIQGAQNIGRTTGAVVANTGTISVDASTGGAVGLGDDAQLTNSGTLETRSVLTKDNRTVEVGDNSRVENQASGTIRGQELPGSTPPKPGEPGIRFQTVVLGAGSTLVNAGLIELKVPTGTGRGNAVYLQGDQTRRGTVENTGTIDASTGAVAIRMVGLSTVANSGRILGGRQGAIELSNAEGSELILRTGSDIAGQVSVRASESVPLTDAELGNDPVVIDYCRQNPTDAQVCRKNAVTLPSRATLTLEGTGTEDDRITGFNLIQKRDAGAWTLGTSLQAGSASDSFQSGDFRGPLTVDVQDAAGQLNLTGAITDASDGTKGELVKNGAGVLALAGNNTYSGPTRINAGVLQTNGGNGIGDNSAVTVAAGAALALNASETIGSLAGAGNVTLGGYGLRAGGNNTSTTFSGVASGSGSLEKLGTGTLVLAGANTYTGQTRVTGGELQLDGSLLSSRIVLDSAQQSVRLSGTGSTTGEVVVGPGSTVAPGGSTAGGTLTVGDLFVRTGGRIEIDAREQGGSVLLADRLNVDGKATFGLAASGYGETEIDVKFDANATIPALQGILIVDATNGLEGRAPRVTLDPASLPHGQNFTLDLEATNLGGTFARPGEMIPTGAGGAGFVVLQIKNLNVVPQTITAHYTAINGPIVIPPLPLIVAPPQAPVLVPPLAPNLAPTLAPALVLGPTATVVTPVVTAPPGQTTTPHTGIIVQNHGVQIGGSTLVPTPTTPGNVPPVGTATPVVTVVPPTNLGTSNFVSITGSYGAVDQTNAPAGVTYRLGYAPHQVNVYTTPTHYGNLAPFGTSLTAAQSQVGNALTSMLPAPYARPGTDAQAALVNALYPLSASQIASALNSVSGEGTDPTFVTAMNSRLFQTAIEDRLQGHRGSAPRAVSSDLPVNRHLWGIALGSFGSGDYLEDADLTTGGFVLGADGDLGNGLVAGAALGYVDTSIDPGPGGNADVASLEAAGYAHWTDGPWFATGLAGLGYHWLDLDRRVSVGDLRDTATSSPDGWGVFVAATAGRRFDLDRGVALEPLVGLRYDHVWRNSFTESGAAFADRAVDGDSLDAAQAFVGARVYTEVKLDDGTRLWPEFNAGYAREIGNTDIVTSASLVDAPGSSFTVTTEGPGDDVGLVGVRLSGEGTGGMAFFLDYHAELRSDYTGNVVRAGVSVPF